MAHNCLKNKVIFIIGDSTGRQYRDYFIDILKGNLVMINDGMRNQENIFNSTGLHFRLHAYPSAHDSMHARSLKYTTEIIDSIVGGPNVVVILSIWAHYTALPLETFTSRVYGIRHAIERLQRRNPGTKVVWRTSNMRGHTELGHFVQNSNWYAYQFVLAAKRILSDLDIFIMDVWDMSVCTKYIIHPEPHVIKNHIDLILSYMCPQ
ncbi:NXPE family member 3-like [Branchiostoma lanceolatum]|uniref:NXPE family member 3-like n=1 Tax=Branchiostoma lanceolatum TaxID=7740 RepID=UPI003453DCCA